MSEGKVVDCSEADSVRVALAGGGAVQVPAAWLAAADRVLAHCRDREVSLHLELVEEERGGVVDLLWSAAADPGLGPEGEGPTPWAALLALAGLLRRAG